MRVIKTRDYKWDRSRFSRSAPCRAGPACIMRGTGETRSGKPDNFPCTQLREKRIDDLPIHLQGI
ncbi:hypothetical protein D1006_12375 [Burkholderia stabilis]|uniref:Uncharacterized protein n=1 Tax=Burkholderia stabilis TaxID=95485 RepID=A0A4Q2AWS1_9BURK|nr:hypothetical protein D1006_12375 [Burkholderia stabilis]